MSWMLLCMDIMYSMLKKNHNQGAKAKSDFEGHEDKQDDDKDLSFNFDDKNNNNPDQFFLKNKGDITDSKFNKGNKQFFFK